MRIFKNEEIIEEKSADIAIPSFGQTKIIMETKGPGSPGLYTVVASLERKDDRAIKSFRDIPFIVKK